MFSERLQQAINVGMVHVDESNMVATIYAPPMSDEMTNDDWLLVLRAATEVRHELESLGYIVSG